MSRDTGIPRISPFGLRGELSGSALGSPSRSSRFAPGMWVPRPPVGGSASDNLTSLGPLPRMGRSSCSPGPVVPIAGTDRSRQGRKSSRQSGSGSTCRSAVSPWRRAHSAKNATRRCEMIRGSLHGQPSTRHALRSGFGSTMVRRSWGMSTAVRSVHLGRCGRHPRRCSDGRSGRVTGASPRWDLS